MAGILNFKLDDKFAVKDEDEFKILDDIQCVNSGVNWRDDLPALEKAIRDLIADWEPTAPAPRRLSDWFTSLSEKLGAAVTRGYGQFAFIAVPFLLILLIASVFVIRDRILSEAAPDEFSGVETGPDLRSPNGPPEFSRMTGAQRTLASSSSLPTARRLTSNPTGRSGTLRTRAIRVKTVSPIRAQVPALRPNGDGHAENRPIPGRSRNKGAGPTENRTHRCPHSRPCTA